MSKVAINGVSGRMGRAILKILLEKGHTLGASFEAKSSPSLGNDAGTLIDGITLNSTIEVINEESMQNVDCLIDFSAPEATIALIDILKHLKKSVVIGTTGFSEDKIEVIKELSKSVPVLFSPNMSIGVNLLFKLTEFASRSFTRDYDIEIFEAHHRHKKDAPSGTAIKLMEIVKNNAPELNDADEKYERKGMIGERNNNEIGIMSMRGGEIVGEHTVFFIGREERVELTHRASSRDALARGAVIGMEYIISQKPGLYNMFDVLGL